MCCPDTCKGEVDEDECSKRVGISVHRLYSKLDINRTYQWALVCIDYTVNLILRRAYHDIHAVI